MTTTSKTTATGTCQICGRTCKLPRGKVSLHGYDRPGTGFISGRCYGAGELPLEQSCEALVRYLGLLGQRLGAARETLARAVDLRDNGTEVTEYRHRRGEKTEILVWKRGERYATSEYLTSVDMFGCVTEGRVRSAQDTVRAIERELAAQTARLTAETIAVAA